MTAGAPASILTIADAYDRVAPAVEDAMIATSKSFGQAVPAPRGDAFHGLDRWGGPSLRVLERMTAHGDFRKYVFVLDAGGGLGGVARWLTVTYGCRVLVLDVVPRLLATGRRLSKRARLDGRISALAGSFEAIPVRDGVFTQIWSVEALHHARDRARALAELFRVLRPGSTLAFQEIVRRSTCVPMIGGAWRHGTIEEYVTDLVACGFTHIDCEDVTAERTDASAVRRSAEIAFERDLEARAPDAAALWKKTAERLRQIETITQGPDYRTVQIYARRPSTRP
jgi:SAM-dependent methyltransferase